MSNRWWRAYDEAIDSAKLQQLPDRLFKAWFNLMCLASANDGALPAIDVIAFKLRMTKVKAAAAIDGLRNARLFDEGDNKLMPHNWSKRQYKSDVTDSTNAERQRRYRERHGITATTVTETVTDKRPENREQTTEEQSQTSSLRSEDARATPAEAFEEFWKRYPNKVGKADARKAFERVAKSATIEFAPLMAALDRYCTKSDDRPWCNPATWLNQGRWDDQPAGGLRNGKSTRGKSLADAADDLIARAENRERANDFGDPDAYAGPIIEGSKATVR